jgi:dCMP deaminase
MPVQKDTDGVLIQVAKIIATQSKATRLQVGAVIAIDGRIVSTGFNGTPMGADNACEGEDGKTLPMVIHAETNAIMFAARNGLATSGATMYVTHAPCEGCSGAIVQAGIKRIVYADEYRSGNGVQLLRSLGVNVKKHD